MTHAGKCPKCDKPLSYVEAEKIAVRQSSEHIQWKGVSLICPSCSSILSVSIEPAELKALNVEAVAEIQTYVRLSLDQSVRQALHEATEEVERVVSIRLKLKPKGQKAIFSVLIHKMGNEWFMDDVTKEIVNEPLICGMPEIIEHIVGRDIHCFAATFSNTTSEDQQVLLRREPENGGYWYELKGASMRGWLCPVLFRYFDEAPLNLYVSWHK